MTELWWACNTCGQELYDSQGVYAHRQNSGHVGAGIVTKHCGSGPGSTDAGRARAREIFEQTRREQANPADDRRQHTTEKERNA